VIVNGHIASAKYTVVAQNRDEMMVPENSPSVSMLPYLLNSSQPPSAMLSFGMPFSE
jgi:hypothetical protein